MRIICVVAEWGMGGAEAGQWFPRQHDFHFTTLPSDYIINSAVEVARDYGNSLRGF